MPKRLNHQKLLEQETAFAERTTQFRSGKLFPPWIYSHLKAFGVEIDRSLILTWFPDGDGTLAGSRRRICAYAAARFTT